MSISSGHTAGARTIVITGTNLSSVVAVDFGGTRATGLRVTSNTRMIFVLGAAYNYQPGRVPVILTQKTTLKRFSTPLIFTYKVVSAVDKEMNYAFDNWNTRGTKRWVYIANNDCVNFASQVLLARGWKMNNSWYNNGGWKMSASWSSSTALRNYLKARPKLATALTEKQRASVKVGDIVQFDWDGNGSPNHTAIISKKTVDADGHITLLYAAHTNHQQYANVDWAYTKKQPHVKIMYWSVK